MDAKSSAQKHPLSSPRGRAPPWRAESPSAESSHRAEALAERVGGKPSPEPTGQAPASACPIFRHDAREKLPLGRAPPWRAENPCGKLSPCAKALAERAESPCGKFPPRETERADFHAQRPARRGEKAPARSGRGAVPKRTRRPDFRPAAGSLCFAKFRSGREVRRNFRNLTAGAAGRPAGPGWPEPAWPERTAPECCSWCRPSSPRQRRCRGWWTRRPGCSRS